MEKFGGKDDCLRMIKQYDSVILVLPGGSESREFVSRFKRSEYPSLKSIIIFTGAQTDESW